MPSQPAAIVVWPMLLEALMSFLTDDQRRQMLANGEARTRGEDTDPYPVLKLYTPDALKATLPPHLLVPVSLLS